MEITQQEWDNAPFRTWHVERGVKPSQLQDVLNKAKKSVEYILQAEDGTLAIVQSSQKFAIVSPPKPAADPSNRSEWFEL